MQFMLILGNINGLTSLKNTLIRNRRILVRTPSLHSIILGFLLLAIFITLSGGLTVKTALLSSPMTSSSAADIIITAESGIHDSQLDDDDFFFQALNVTDPRGSLVANVSITVCYQLNDTVHSSGMTNNSGVLIIHDVPKGTYAWEATHENEEVVDSGILVADGVIVQVTTRADNWDYQGDAGDIRFYAEERDAAIPISDVNITLYSINGTVVNNCKTDFTGECFFHDLPDGMYSFEARFRDELIEENQVTVDSSKFNIETDNTAPVVTIISPYDGGSFCLRNYALILEYSVEETNNYTIAVFVNDKNVGFIANGSVLNYGAPPVIAGSGLNVLRVEATDIAGNIGHDEVHFTVIVHATTQVPTSIGSSTQGLLVFLSLGLLVVVYRKQK
ncbi:MAG: hypothetical protein ACXAEU_24835 [Candidatus Hodarchaeales archaeon]|jgi:hypothetical protein